MEESLRFKETLACPYKEDLQKMRFALCKEVLREDKKKNFFLRELPGGVWINVAEMKALIGKYT